MSPRSLASRRDHYSGLRVDIYRHEEGLGQWFLPDFLTSGSSGNYAGGSQATREAAEVAADEHIHKPTKDGGMGHACDARCHAWREIFHVVVLKREDNQYEVLERLANGDEPPISDHAYSSLDAARHAAIKHLTAGRIGYRDWRTPEVTDPLR